MYTKGSTVRSTMDYIAHALDDVERAGVLARLDPEDRRLILEVDAIAEVPYRVVLALWRSIDKVLGPRDPQWAERAGAEAIEVTGMQLYPELIARSTPLEWINQYVSLFQLYYRPGDMIKVDEGPHRITTRLVGFDDQDPLFCRRLVGGFLAAIRLARGRDVSVRHTRCVHEGDLFCEWESSWR